MGSSDRTWVVLDSLVTQANRVPGTATIAVRLSDELKRQDWAGVRGQSPLWRSPGPAETGSADRSSEGDGRKADKISSVGRLPSDGPNSVGRLRLLTDRL